MAPGGFEIAALSAGASIVITDAVIDGQITNGYALTRWAAANVEGLQRCSLAVMASCTA
jgi:hypothetical protein